MNQNNMDSGQGYSLDHDRDFSLEFQYADLDLDEKLPADELVTAIHYNIVDEMQIDTYKIVGVHLMPVRRPVRVMIYCTDRETKDSLKIRGLNIFGSHIKFDEPGQGFKRIEVQNAPGYLPLPFIKAELAKYGKVVQLRDATHKLKTGQKTQWTTGTKIAFMRGVKALPPVVTVTWAGKPYKLNIWYYGQDDMECRFCKEIVKKGHQCDLAPPKRCFSCGQWGHMKGECTTGQSCFICGEKDHISPDCPNSSRNKKQPEKVYPIFDKSKQKSTPAISQTPVLPKDVKKHQRPVPKFDIHDTSSFPSMSTGATGHQSKTASAERRTRTSTSDTDVKEGGHKPTRKQRKSRRVRKGYATGGEPETDESGEEDDYTSDSDGISSDEEGSQVSSDILITVTKPSPKSGEESNEESTSQEIINREEKSDTEAKMEEIKTAEESGEESENEEEPMDVAEDKPYCVEVVAVGGSNCKKLHTNLAGDAEMQIKPTVLCEPGLMIEGMSGLVSQLSPEEGSKVKLVVVHVGTCNFPIQNVLGLEFMYFVYEKQLKNVRALCPNAHIIISSIIPRSGDTPAVLEINEQVRQMNERLVSLTDSKEHLHLCNNDSYLLDEQKKVERKFYRSNDRDGVHLNRTGRNALAEALGSRIKEVAITFNLCVKQPESKHLSPVRSAEVMSSMEEVVSSSTSHRHV